MLLWCNVTHWAHRTRDICKSGNGAVLGCKTIFSMRCNTWLTIKSRDSSFMLPSSLFWGNVNKRTIKLILRRQLKLFSYTYTLHWGSVGDRDLVGSQEGKYPNIHQQLPLMEGLVNNFASFYSKMKFGLFFITETFHYCSLVMTPLELKTRKFMLNTLRASFSEDYSKCCGMDWTARFKVNLIKVLVCFMSYWFITVC